MRGTNDCETGGRSEAIFMIWICELPKLKVMHGLPRRIEELEKVALVIKRDRQAVEDRACRSSRRINLSFS
jgi:hypothetical protein